MPETPTQIQTSETQPFNKHKSKTLNLILSILIIILLIIQTPFWLHFLGVLDFSRFFSFLRQNNSQVKQLQKTIDVLGLPGWYGSSKLPRQLDGSLQISTSPGGSESLVRNSSDFIEVDPNGFEISVKMRAVPREYRDSPAGNIVEGKILLYNMNPFDSDTPARLESGVDSEGNFSMLYSDIDGPKTLVSRGGNIKPTDGALRIVFNTSKNELSIYDGVTGALLKSSIRLPNPSFLSESNKFYFGFYPVSYSAKGAVMTVDYFKVFRK